MKMHPRSWIKNLLLHLSAADLQRLLEAKLAHEPEFMFNTHLFRYFFHSYNNFGLTERAIEIPIIKHYLEEGKYQNVLEIGNVTNHYYECFKRTFMGVRRTVVDKYEVGYDVINQDISEYAPASTFDFIFSISTFEHMDSDLGRNSNYVAGTSKLVTVAADNIKHLSDVALKKGGKLVITAPLGYTPEWDKTFYSDAFDQCNFARHQIFLFRRKSELTWEQVDVSEGRSAKSTAYLSSREFLTILECDK